MDVTQLSDAEKKARAKKMMLWLGIGSLIMSFAGWTSAYIVSSSREDWLKDFNLPTAFLYSTAVIILSSISFYIAQKRIKKDNKQQGTLWLLITLALGVTFIVLQFIGFSQMIQQGYYFTGPTSNVTTSYIFLIAAVHIAHVVVGLITLVVVLYNHLKDKYSSKEALGLEMGGTFWHFVDLLWVYLVLFFYFY